MEAPVSTSASGRLGVRTVARGSNLSRNAVTAESCSNEAPPLATITGSTTTGGGGGFGDPLKRDPRLVLEDVRNGFVSDTAANAIYGVVFNGQDLTLEVDEEATNELRANKQ